MAKNNSIIVDNLYAKVVKNISKPDVKRKLAKAISEYFDENSEIINDIGISKRLFFLNKDKEAIFEAAGLDPKEIKDVIKQSEYISDTWKVLTEPLNIAAALLIRYFTISKDKMRDIFIVYYSFYFYASLHFKYLKYGANEDIMAYTINNLSYKFKIKETGSLYETIKAVVLKSHEKYAKDLVKGEDGDFAKYISAIKVRLNDVVKNLKNEYTKNYNEKNYLNADQDDYSEENYHDADNTSYAVKRISDASLMRLMTYGPDMRLVSMAAQLSEVSQSEIRNTVMHLSNNDAADISALSELILQLFLYDNENSIDQVSSKKFLVKCMEIYKKSNTSDKTIIKIKAILDKWLKRYSVKYRQTNREATLSNFRKAIFIYFVLHIETSSR